MNMSAQELGLSNPRQLINKFNGRQEAINTARAYDRLHAFFIVKAQGVKAIKSPRDLYQIPGLDDRFRPHFSGDQLEKLLDKWGRTLPGATVMNKAELLKLKKNPS